MRRTEKQVEPYPRRCEWYGSDKVYMDLKDCFVRANQKLLNKDNDLFMSDSSERTICGALMLKLKSTLFFTPFSHYSIDTEYNRSFMDRKRILVDDHNIAINCDLIVHSRGKSLVQDNLISIEMKKEYRPLDEKNRDKVRLQALTRASFDDMWVYDGTELPAYVCRYIIGIYYEIMGNGSINVEYYRYGDLEGTDVFAWR